MLKISVYLLKNYLSKVEGKPKTGLDKVTIDKFRSVEEQEFEIIRKKIMNRTYKFTRLKRISTKEERHVYIPTIRDRIVLEFLKDQLDSKYRNRFTNRNNIIFSIKEKLNYSIDFFIVRLDIKDFFNSIPQNLLLHKLKRTSLLSIYEYHLIKEAIKLQKKGISQGLSISNSLAEIYLEELDLRLKRLDFNINYYNRYVDDIIIIINGDLSVNKEKKLKENIESIFKKSSLKLNTKKVKYIRFLRNRTQTFSFLGYEFHNREKESMIVKISNSKKELFKKKVNFCFAEYRSNKNFHLLYERINYLFSSNSFLKFQNYIDEKGKHKIKPTKIFFGILESYKFVTIEEWEELSKYYIQKLNSIKKILSRSEKRQLFTYKLFYKNIRYNKFYKCNKKYYVQKIKSISPTLEVTVHNNINNLIHIYFGLLQL